MVPTQLMPHSFSVAVTLWHVMAWILMAVNTRFWSHCQKQEQARVFLPTILYLRQRQRVLKLKDITWNFWKVIYKSKTKKEKLKERKRPTYNL